MTKKLLKTRLEAIFEMGSNKLFSMALILNILNFSSGIPLWDGKPISLPLIFPSKDGAQYFEIPLFEGIRKKTVMVTAYSSTFDQTDDTPYITASNTRVRDGIVAANFLPFKTKVMIPELFGNKIFVVEDRMHRRFSDRVDIWFPDRSSAKRFGVKSAEIIILDA